MPSPRFSTSQRPTAAARHRPVCDHRQPKRGPSGAPAVPRRQASGTLAVLEAECSEHAPGVSACHRGADECSGCTEGGPAAFCPSPPLGRLRSGTWPPKPAEGCVRASATINQSRIGTLAREYTWQRTVVHVRHLRRVPSSWVAVYRQRRAVSRGVDCDAIVHLSFGRGSS
jgi:hypothetical protein